MFWLTDCDLKQTVTMSVQFSGWEVVDDGACFPGVMLAPAQKPQNKGIYKMFHGTSVASARAIVAGGFQPSSGGMLGKGVYMSRDVKKASNYPYLSTSSNRVILELRVRVGRVKRIDKDNHPLQHTWSSNGYNTAWVPPNCGMKSVPSGLEEDCVFDPKRVTVVGVAKAPTTAIEKELQQLLAKASKQPKGKGGHRKDVCSLCKRKTQQGAHHIKQKCWTCGQDICILTSKHFCQRKPMSLQFFGWEVTYDDDSPRLELGASQEPKDRGVYTMYHGTTVANARLIIANGFRQSTKGMLGNGVYVSRDRKKAERYPLNISASDRVVLKLHVRVGHVKRIDKDNHPMQYTWSSNGYDTAWVPPNCGMKAVPSGLEEDCVFDPSRITVVDIARAPNSDLEPLKQLVANSLGKPKVAVGSGAVAADCSLCNRKLQQNSAHVTQACWGCGQNICTLMTKHVCSVRI
ncbi:LOW QUALITY PROTEIN: uncharacterized protein LOC116729663 [Xiphophorus hellerii]|uniref:LOW QUALITY PROTEIN: uncharacterized protein LOC116729663 n=1 Tax=Xiphophorus hellerii TaxID=8084 RepID=UPI0013B3B531|nr:LOW QUALITY PROTEIN: uncharacterized protein LOC116729663 [Xiphophorus hellerii]